MSELTGDVVILGADGLKGLALTDRATAATIDNGLAAPGLADGQATVRMTGVATVANLNVAAAVNQFAAVYRVPADGTYTGTATGNTKIGYAMATTAAAGIVPVALCP